MQETAGAELGLTGNPFVDTGLEVLAALAGLDDVDQLNMEVVRRVHGDGSKITDWNGSLTCFTMLFTSNSLLTNPSIKDKSHRTKLYKTILNGLLDSIGNEEVARRCEACGCPRSLDFAEFSRHVLSGVEAKEEARFLGRDWFPLAGSLGSDAQALPAASRPVCLCAKCLFAVHYMPLGVLLVDGLLGAFQCTSTSFSYELVRDICEEMQNRIAAGRYGVLGAKEGSSALAQRLLGLFERLQTAGREGEIDTGTALYVWRFTNSGQPPKDGITCRIEEIPNSALSFLWRAVRQGFRKEVSVLAGGEGRKHLTLLRCIGEGRDFPGLYPRRGRLGASPQLFALYQREVLGRSTRVLGVAQALARHASERSAPCELKRLRREGALSEWSVQTQFRGWIIDLAEHGEFTYADYSQLFPPNNDIGLSVRPDGWELIGYYLHHVDDAEEMGSGLMEYQGLLSKAAVIDYYALCFFEDYLRRRGRERFQAEVLDRMRSGQIGPSWLRMGFTRLAEEHPGFTYETYEVLCKGRGSAGSVWELLFQMRLLWTEWMRKETLPSVNEPLLLGGSGLPARVEDRLKHVIVKYLAAKGLARFRESVLSRLRRRDAGLQWFRRVLVTEPTSVFEGVSFSSSDWEEFLKDEEGRPSAGERLLQMHLMLANLWREANES